VNSAFSRHFSTFYEPSVQAMDTQLNALPTLPVLARGVSGCLNCAFLGLFYTSCGPSLSGHGYPTRPTGDRVAQNARQEGRHSEEIGRGRTQNAVATCFLADGGVRWLRSTAVNRTQSRAKTEAPDAGGVASRVLEESQEPQRKVRPEGNRLATLQPRPARVDMRCGSG